jgi:peptide/nickel transport system permease protein
MALVGLGFLALLAIVVLVGPVIYHSLGHPDPYALSCPILAQPSSAHPLGCDGVGRDLLARLLAGGRISLGVGLMVAVGSSTIGLVIGAIAGYCGGRTDNLLMRFTDTVLALPALFLVLAAAAVLGPSLVNTVVIISAIQWTTTARLVRGEFLALRGREFVMAAHAVGLPPLRIGRHILVNVIPTIVVAGTLAVATGILTESALSFLGMGTQPPQASWGYMLSNAQQYVFTRPMLGVYPGLLIMLTVLAVNFVGEGVRQTVDPRLTTA